MPARRSRRTQPGARVTMTPQATSFQSNNSTLSMTADLPWWAQAGISIGTGIAGGDSFGGSVNDYLCRTFNVRCPSNGGGGGLQPTGLPGVSPCPQGTIRIGETCVAPGDAFPGGDPLFRPAGGVATTGAFGLPAMQPAVVPTVRRECGPGMILGKDDLCYAKGSISVRDRKWRPKPKPPISAGDAKAIRRADRAKNRVKRLATKSGFTCRKR